VSSQLRKDFGVFQWSDLDVHFDNKLDKQDLRRVKIRPQIFGCFRIENIVENFCRILKLVCNTTKTRITMLKAIQVAFSDQNIRNSLHLNIYKVRITKKLIIVLTFGSILFFTLQLQKRFNEK